MTCFKFIQNEYEIEIKTLINNKFMLINKWCKSINLCINLVFICIYIRK